MKEKNRLKWEKIREKGKKQYIWKYGALYWGLPMFIIMTFFVNNRNDYHHSLFSIALSIIVWLFAGILFGIVTWGINERKYLKSNKEKI